MRRMNGSEDIARRRPEGFDELSMWAVGLGVVVVGVFPLSIPILVLTGAALLALALPLVAIALVTAPVAVAVRLLRGLRPRSGAGSPQLTHSAFDPGKEPA